MKWRIGVDVGGTHTDAALLDPELACVASVKVPTTRDVSSGVAAAIETLMQAAPGLRRLVGLAMLGTTHCTNAVVERRELQRVGLLRLAAPSTEAVPPRLGWPQDLMSAFAFEHRIVRGGFEYDGRVLAEPDEAEIRNAVRGWLGAVDAVALCGVFSPVNATQELRAAQWVRDELGDDVTISLSSEIGTIGLLERESATILNAALGGVARHAIDGFRRALGEVGLGHARPFLGQNDGTLMTLEAAESYPILTLGSGPTNSLRGAAFLSGLRDAVVIDVGGTTADIGVLLDGFPRESASAVDIGGVKLNLRMPDILALGLGGGTIVRQTGAGLTLGPDSVGHGLTTRAQCFGGDTLTLTDVAIGAGVAPPFGPFKPQAERPLCLQAHAQMLAGLEEGIDRMKVGVPAAPVVLVGGGSLLVPDALAGASCVVRPAHFGAANAIGVAIAEMGGEVDRVVRLPRATRDEALGALRGEALAAAARAGADPASTRVLTEEITPLAYMPGDACRVRIRAAGPVLAASQGFTHPYPPGVPA
jgi:N-methylhydantoinase A/oxoprolinase/acetone carboxylase beta subunit